jgi:hypothetical protein
VLNKKISVTKAAERLHDLLFFLTDMLSESSDINMENWSVSRLLFKLSLQVCAL